MANALTPRERECLKCGKLFQSLGHHNRMCDDCRRSNQSLSSRVTKTNNQRLKGKSDNEGSH